MIAFALLLQAAAAEPTERPDIELQLSARAREVRIERKGEARLEVRGSGPGNDVEVRVEPKAEGRTVLRNVTVELRARASVEEGAEIKADAQAAEAAEAAEPK